MKTTDFIKTSLDGGKNWLLNLATDMKDAPLTEPTPKGGNHPLWVLGHIVHSESGLLDVFINGKPNRFPELENCQAGSQPTPNADDYPSMDELLGELQSDPVAARKRVYKQISGMLMLMAVVGILTWIASAAQDRAVLAHQAAEQAKQ